MTSTTTDLRTKHFNNLISLYYKSLNATIKMCGSDPEQLFTFEQLQKQFKKFSKFGVLISPILIKLIISDPNNIRNVDEFAEKLDTKTDDSKILAKLDNDSSIVFKERVTGAISDAYKYDWI